MSDIKHTASLEVIIYGRKAIDKLTSSLEQAAVEFENIEKDAEAAARATKKFGDQQMQSSRLVVRNAKDAAKAIQIINEEQQKSLAGASKSQIAARKKMFADIGLSMPSGIRSSTARAAQGRVRNLVQGGTKSSADLGRSFTEINNQVLQAERIRVQAVKAQREAESKALAETTKGLNAASQALDELKSAVKKAQNKIPIGQRHDDKRQYALEKLGSSRTPSEEQELHNLMLDRGYAINQKSLHDASQALKELKFEARRAGAQLRIRKAVEKDAAADFNRRIKVEQDLQAQYERPVGKRHSARRMAELAIQVEDPAYHGTTLAEIEEVYSKHLRDKLFAESEKKLREADKVLDALKVAAKKAKDERQRHILQTDARREAADRHTERFITSMVPRQLQPFFRRGGLFAQDHYINMQAAAGTFGGIRGALGRGGQFGEGGEGGQSGPMRVIAYDALRRVLTETYSMVSKIAGTFKDWIIEGVKFNDELVRAQTFFTSLGLIGMKGASGQDVTVAEASVSSNVKIKQAYEKSSVAAEEMMNRMMAVSALTGQDLGEIVSSARQSMTDLLNKVNKTSGGKTSAFLENPKMFGDVSERMVKLAAVLRMADPQNRKLGFHMVGLQELFSGSTGGKKDSGLQNVLSILRREGIKIEQGVATAITKLVNKGDITGAMDLVEDALSRAGLGMVQLENMLNSTLQPAIDGAIMYAKIFNRIFTKTLYENSLKPFFRSLLKTSDAIFRNKGKMEALEGLGARFARALDPIFLRLLEILDFIQYKYYDNSATSYLNNTIDSIAGIIDVILAFSEVMVAFTVGLMGGAGGTGLSQLSEWIRSFIPTMFKFGVTVRKTIEWVQALDVSLGNSIKNIALIVMAALTISGMILGVGSAILGLVTPVLMFVWALLKLRNVIVAMRGVTAAAAAAETVQGAAKGRAAATAATVAAEGIAGAAGGAGGAAAANKTASAAKNVVTPAVQATKTAAQTGIMATLKRVGPRIVGELAIVALTSTVISAIVAAAVPVAVATVIAAVGGTAAYYLGGAYANYELSRETNANPSTRGKMTVPVTNVATNRTTSNTTQNVNITVNAASSDPNAIGKEVGKSTLDALSNFRAGKFGAYRER